MDTIASIKLTRAEDAYAHLASFQRGDMVTVIHRAFTIKGTVTEPQRDGSSLLGAYLTVEGTMTMTLPDNQSQHPVKASVIGVDMLLSGYSIRARFV